MSCRKRLAMSAGLLLFYVAGWAQTPAPDAMPVIVPPSPELASLAKVGAMSTSLHTGAATVNIPLYQLSDAGLQMPVSLSYATNGIRVNDIASRVGLGWNLVAGGVISRVIHDEDDLAPEIQHPALPASLAPDNSNEPLYDYLQLANMDEVDTERDEYTFSVNGLSGKFFFDDNGVPRQVEHSNIKIEKSGNIFILTDAAGTKYYFGENDNIEKTRGYLTNGTGRWDRISTTGWFLTRVVSQGRTIFSFNYVSLFIKTLRGPSQSMVIKPQYGPSGTGTNCEECDPICAGAFKNPVMNQVDYDTKKLESIVSSNGVQVYFVYESRGDDGGDHRLKNLLVQQTVNSPATQVKKYLFEYDDFPITSDWNKRFYLKRLVQEATATFPPGSAIANNTSQVHEFEYNDPAGMPSQKSYDQDYYGYANSGGNMNTYFVPKPEYYQQYWQGNLLANRAPNFTYMQKGTLKKVIYPTGGFEAFDYEQHTIAEQLYDSAYTSSTRSGAGLFSPTSPNTFTFNFTTNNITTIKATLSASQNPAGPFPGESGYWYPEDAHHLVEFVIKRASDNVAVTTTAWLNIYDTTMPDYSLAGLLPNTAYIGELKVFGQSTFGKVILEYNPTVTSYWNNKGVCGLRVNNIQSHDPVSNQTTRKYYKYAAIDNLNVSSGKGVAEPSFISSFASGGICLNMCGSATWVEQIECNNNIQLSSSSLSQLPDYGGSPVAYTDVIESDDPAFVNGAVHHKFSTLPYPAGVAVPIFGPGVITAPTGDWPNQNGKELLTGYYKMQAGQLKLVKKIENAYSTDNRIYIEAKSYLHRKRWDPFQYQNVNFYGMEMLLKPFDMVSYSFKSQWIHLDNTTVTEYDGDGLNPVVSATAYEYGNTGHTMPTRVTTTSSSGESIVNETKYPADYVAAPYTTMISQNMLAAPIENKTTKGSATTIVTTQYKDWFSNGNIIKPWLVDIKKGANANETRLRYNELDAAGNILEVKKENGVPTAYIWDESGQPVAEVKNAAAADIAFSSFESASSGTWTIMGTMLPVGSTDLNTYHTYYNEGVASRKSYGGRLTRTVNPSKTYTITLWSKAVALPTVNSVTGTHLLTKNGWNLYRWNVNGVSSITVQGDQVDEVRLYPAGSLMTTYNYYPFTGVASMGDPAGNMQQFEYDGFGRLILVRDIDRNIIKQYDYKLAQAIAPCASTAADWQPTGVTRCVTDANNNYTGVKEQEERDENNCSATYLTIRWTTIATPPGECVPVPGCTGPDKRWVNGVCETGVKTVVSSVKDGNIWHCTYRYVWSDGYQGPTFVESGTQKCLGEIEEL